MLEWLKRHAWKACIPLKGIRSSNLLLSATENESNQRAALAKSEGGFVWETFRGELALLRKISHTKPRKAKGRAAL